MGKRRIIVPDASVMLPAFFQETRDYRGNAFDYTRRAKPIADAIRRSNVIAVAPDLLYHEFAKRAVVKLHDNPALGVTVVDSQFQAFLQLPIRMAPARGRLADLAWRYMTGHSIPPPDSWYLACAVLHQAELWISHDHKDGLAQSARKVYPRVYLLTEHTFHQEN